MAVELAHEGRDRIDLTAEAAIAATCSPTSSSSWRGADGDTEPGIKQADRKWAGVVAVYLLANVAVVWRLPNPEMAASRL